MLGYLIYSKIMLDFGYQYSNMLIDDSNNDNLINDMMIMHSMARM